MTTISRRKLAIAVKKYRKDNDLTLQEMADKIPTTLNTVYRWESGKAIPRNKIMIDRLKNLGIEG